MYFFCSIIRLDVHYQDTIKYSSVYFSDIQFYYTCIVFMGEFSYTDIYKVFGRVSRQTWTDFCRKPMYKVALNNLKLNLKLT